MTSSQLLKPGILFLTTQVPWPLPCTYIVNKYAWYAESIKTFVIKINNAAVRQHPSSFFNAWLYFNG